MIYIVRYRFLKYTPEHTAIAESFFDEEARRMTGCDDGWEDYYSYYMSEESVEKLEEDFWCRLVYLDGQPLGILAFGIHEGTLTVSEFVISPEMRGKGHGNAILTDFLEEYTVNCGLDYERAMAVIYPENTASRRAFEKAGFVFDSAHPDGDALYYIYQNRIKK